MTVKTERLKDLKQKIVECVPLRYDVLCHTCLEKPKRLSYELPFSITEFKEADKIAHEHDSQVHKNRGKVLIKWGKDQTLEDQWLEADE